MATTIGDTISRVRNTIKGVRQDAFLTDRYVYSLILKYAKLYIRRQDAENKIMRFSSLFEPIPCIELIEVDKIEACCADISTGNTIMRTKDKIPTVLEGEYGPLFKTVASLDSSQECTETTSGAYTSMTKTSTFKYNKTLYYWYLNGYLYFPNIMWEAVRVEALWEDSVQMYTCDGKDCTPRQDDPTHFPEYLFAEIEQNVIKELTLLMQVPSDPAVDKQSQLRT